MDVFPRSICRCGAGGVRVTYPNNNWVYTCLECRASVTGATDEEALGNWNTKNLVERENSDESPSET